MAAPPKAQAVTLDPSMTVDVDGQKVPHQQQLDDLVSQLNDFMNSVQGALAGKLSDENFQQQVKVLRVPKGVEYPLAFSCSLPTRAQRISCNQVVTISGPAPTTAVDVTQWRLKDAKTIEILSIPGLSASGTYDLTLVIR